MVRDLGMIGVMIETSRRVGGAASRRLVIEIAAFVPVLLCALALTDESPVRWWPLLLSVAAVAWLDRRRNPDLWALSRERRSRLRRAIESGRPTGDPDLDHIGADRLSRPAKSYPASLFFGYAIFVMVLALPIVASIIRNPLWALALPLPTVLVVAHRRALFSDPRDTFRRFAASAEGVPEASLGDRFRLPPVGPGNDLHAWNRYCVTTLLPEFLACVLVAWGASNSDGSLHVGLVMAVFATWLAFPLLAYQGYQRYLSARFPF
jgi:hypothetical protein